MILLTSDTETKPTPEMRRVIAACSTLVQGKVTRIDY